MAGWLALFLPGSVSNDLPSPFVYTPHTQTHKHFSILGCVSLEQRHAEETAEKPFKGLLRQTMSSPADVVYAVFPFEAEAECVFLFPSCNWLYISF